MDHAIVVHRHGGPEVLTWEPRPVGSPGPGEIRLAHRAVGVNFIDLYHRSGLYPQTFPFVPGMEGAGVVDAVGPGVEHLAPGDRVGYALVIGGYATARLLPADRVVKLPRDISDETAAAMLLRGLTAEYLVRRTFAAQPGQWAVVHAAAGGTGSILVQWLRAIGTRVIAIVGNEQKAAIATELGAEQVLLATDPQWVSRIRELTAESGGAHVVYDGVGGETTVASLGCLRRRGMLVTFGNASGPAPAIEPLALSRAGSLFLTRPTLGDYIATRLELEEAAAALFDVVTRGQVRISIGQSWPLAEAARAHEALESRGTTGSTILTVSR